MSALGFIDSCEWRLTVRMDQNYLPSQHMDGGNSDLRSQSENERNEQAASAAPRCSITHHHHLTQHPPHKMSSHKCVWENSQANCRNNFSHSHARKSLRSPVTANIAVQVALPGATPTDGPSEVLRMGEHLIHRQEEFYGPRGLCRSSV
jgi:hypothetical protein